MGVAGIRTLSTESQSVRLPVSVTTQLTWPGMIRQSSRYERAALTNYATDQYMSNVSDSNSNLKSQTLRVTNYTTHSI